MMSCCLREWNDYKKVFLTEERRLKCCEVLVNDQKAGSPSEHLKKAGLMHKEQLNYYYDGWRCKPDEPEPEETCDDLNSKFETLVDAKSSLLFNPKVDTTSDAYKEVYGELQVIYNKMVEKKCCE